MTKITAIIRLQCLQIKKEDNFLQTSINNLSFIAHILRLEQRVYEELCKPVKCFSKVMTLDLEIKYHLQASEIVLTLDADTVSTFFDVM